MKELEEGTALTLDFDKLTKAVAACPASSPSRSSTPTPAKSS